MTDTDGLREGFQAGYFGWDADEAKDAAAGLAAHVAALHRRHEAALRAICAPVAAAIDSAEMQAALDADPIADGAFGYVQFDCELFLECLDLLALFLSRDGDYACQELPYRPIHWLELGAGPGTLLRLFRDCGMIGWQTARGVEIVKPYVDLGHRLLRLGDALAQGDAMTVPLGDVDVIFAPRLFTDDDKQIAFETRLVADMRRGAYVIAPLALCLDDDRRMVAKGGSGVIWKKVG